MQDALQKYVYDNARYSHQQDIRLKCLACSPNRKLIHRNEKTLSITVLGDRAAFMCHHCNVRGAVSMQEPASNVNREPKRKLDLQPLSAAAVAFLAKRSISAEHARRLGVRSTRIWFRELHREGEGIVFPYMDPDGGQSFKVRSIETKEFSCVGSPKTLFNCPANAVDTLVIVEGELDVIAAVQSGIEACVSIPSGAIAVEHLPVKPQMVMNAQVANNGHGKLGFLWTHRKLLEGCNRIVIATDADRQGQATAEELARRIGKAKCFLVSFPDGLKDMNDVLAQLGPDAVKALVDGARPFKISGLHEVKEYQTQLIDLHENGLKGGESTGWPTVDKIVTIKEGMLYIVTGVPGSGKSSWIDAVTVNLAKDKGWTTVMASFENPPVIHIAKLCSAYSGVPFGTGHSRRLTPDSLAEASKWVGEHFMFMSNDSEMPTVQSILERAKAGVMRIGAKVVVMDPANFLQFPGDDRDNNDAIDDALSQFKNFAMANDVAFVLVAHPRKPAADTGANWYPQGYSIAGTAGYYNRSDIGITIHRTQDDFTKVVVWKARFGHIAQNGEAMLSYEPSTGTFTESKVRAKKEEADDWI